MATRNPNDQSRLLDCEDEEDRIRRISRLLSTIDSTSNTHQTPRPLEQLMLPSSASSAMDTTQTSELISRVQAFLPQIMAANEELFRRARETHSSVDIEHFDGTEGAYIEMNLGLGLFEQRTGPTAEENASSSGDSSTTTSDTDSSSDPDEDEDTHSSGSDDEEAETPDLIALVTGTRPMRPLPTKRRRKPITQKGPSIVVLSSSDNQPDLPKSSSHAPSQDPKHQ